MAISAVQLARMRAQVNDRLPDSCIIQSVTYSSDGAGGGTPSWTAVSGGTVDCRLDPIQSRDQVGVFQALGRESTQGMYRLTTPYDAPLAENRRVISSGRTYEIVQLDDVHSWNVSRRAIVVETR